MLQEIVIDLLFHVLDNIFNKEVKIKTKQEEGC